MKRLYSTLSALLIITVLCAFSAYAQLSGPLSGTITAGNYTIDWESPNFVWLNSLQPSVV